MITPELKRFILCFLVILNGFNAFSQNADVLRIQTKKIISMMENDQFGKIYSRFSPEFKSNISKKKFTESMEKMTATMGKVTGYGEIIPDTANGKHSSKTEIFLDKNTLNLFLKFNGEEINGFLVSLLSYSFPAVAQNVVFGKESIPLVTDTFKMNGELIFPKDCDHCPVVILVHGSGPNDMDETIGPNKVFMDLALVLATKGIATYRYDKRTKIYPQDFKDGKPFTIADETTDDVRSAIRILKSNSLVDSTRIFVLGHSLGAYAAPLIAKENPELAGVIMMGAPIYPIYHLIEKQVNYLFSTKPGKKRAKKKLAKIVRTEVEHLDNREYDQLKKKTLTMAYWPVDFFRNLENYNPAATLDSAHVPALILQGERDYQVPVSEFEGFQEYFSTHDSAGITMKSFPGLNHLFIYGEGPSTPMEYMRANHVSPDVTNTISDWIRGILSTPSKP
ncbi:MAG: prolyl oligopeptidase family serine peptidase [Bacteroidetes bacterium]|nr:prolyl oligopeptidase family serine peptidase [Bacteroidota bacterium]